MTVSYLAKMLNPEMEVSLKDKANGKVYFNGTVKELLKHYYLDKVRSWDFENDNVIYI